LLFDFQYLLLIFWHLFLYCNDGFIRKSKSRRCERNEKFFFERDNIFGSSPQEKVIHVPILYPSTYFKKHHAKYYQKLDAVRTKGDFEGWTKFYLKAIKESANDACEKAKEIEKLEKQLSKKITTSKNFSLSESQANQALTTLFQFPVISVTELQNSLDVSYNTANSIIQKLVELEILKLETKQKRNKLFRFDSYLSLLEK
jgi:Fic family protein